MNFFNIRSGCSIYEELNNHVTALAERKRLESVALLSQDVHVLPDFHGNRSPVADPNMTGMVSCIEKCIHFIPTVSVKEGTLFLNFFSELIKFYNSVVKPS